MDRASPPIAADQISQGLFVAHGELKVWARGNLLCYAAGGPFNLEMVDVMSRAVGRVLRDWQPPAHYVQLTWWHRSLMASPDTLSAYVQLLRRGREAMHAEIACLWLVGPEIEDAPLMKPRWLAAHQAAGYRLEFCATEPEMMARARALLDAAPRSA